MKKILIFFYFISLCRLSAQPDFMNTVELPLNGPNPQLMKCVNHTWHNTDLSSISNWQVDGANVNWVINIPYWSIQKGNLYRDSSFLPNFAPPNNYRLEFNYRLTPMEWGPIVTHYYQKNSSEMNEVASYHWIDNNIQILENNNYVNDPKKVLVFPFQYQGSFSDAFYSDSTGYDILYAHYTAYGSLSVPSYNVLYTDVAKIKYSTINHGDFYIFWIESPWLIPVLFVDSLTNSYELLVDTLNVSSLKTSYLSDLTFYPNPASEFLYFNLNNKIPLGITITDIYGHKTDIKEYLIGQNRCTVDVSDFNSGVYFIQIIFADGSLNKEIFILKN